LASLQFGFYLLCTASCCLTQCSPAVSCVLLTVVSMLHFPLAG
jgi:hypothetical protein